MGHGLGAPAGRPALEDGVVDRDDEVRDGVGAGRGAGGKAGAHTMGMDEVGPVEGTLELPQGGDGRHRRRQPRDLDRPERCAGGLGAEATRRPGGCHLDPRPPVQQLGQQGGDMAADAAGGLGGDEDDAGGPRLAAHPPATPAARMAVKARFNCRSPRPWSTPR